MTNPEEALKDITEIGRDTSLVLQKPTVLSIEERDSPLPCDPGEVLVRVVVTGLCGSDLHVWKHGHNGNCAIEKPLVLGHESAGIVVATGSGVQNVAIGDRVALEPGAPCNVCQKCRKGSYNLCGSIKFASAPPCDGTLSTYYRLPEEFCYRLPDSISLEEGALVEPLSVAVHSCRLGGIFPCSSLVIFGAGPIGLLCCAVGRAFGATNIVLADIVQSRLDFAQRHLKVSVVNINNTDEQESEITRLWSSLNSPKGANTVINATGNAQCVDYGIQIIERGCSFIQVGISQSHIQFPISAVCEKEINFKGSFRYGPGDYETAIGLLESRMVSVAELITHRYPFSKADEAFTAASSKIGIKSIIYGPSVKETISDGDDTRIRL